MRLPKPVRDNLFFLLAETSSQVDCLQVFLETASAAVSQRIRDRRGYAYNLKMRIHDGCLRQVHQTKSKAALETYSLRAAEAIASELERITVLVHECVRHLNGQERRSNLKALAAAGLLDDVLTGIQWTRLGIEEEDTKTALKIGELAAKVTKKYETFLRKKSRALRKISSSKVVFSALFVAHRLNEMGHVLLDISAAILSARLGHPLHRDRFRFLQTALEDLGLDKAAVETIAETRSGSGVSGIANGDQDGYVAIFKDGEKKKLKEERESVESWNEIFPGLAPQILSYRKRGGSAALLIEYLPGLTFDQILLTGSQELLDNTRNDLTRTLKTVWRETMRSRKVSAQHMTQLRKRLGSVREIHPEFAGGKGRVCGEPTRSLDQLIEASEKLEKKFKAPFSVYIHGDFNLDNIIYDPSEGRINFVDLHRSCYSDYIQDVSVFMVSNYRLQALDARTRSRITQVAVSLHDFAANFAQRNADHSFELRLAFGLARSFITSTRFILDKALATAMYLRGCYILERILEQDRESLADFKLPLRELFS